MATPFRSGRSGRIESSDLRIRQYFGFSQRIASRFFGDPPLTGSQTDDFNDNSLDTTKWQNNSGGRITEVNQRIEITTLTTPGYYSLETKEWQSLYSSSVSVKLTSAGNQSLASLEVYPIVISSNAGLNTLEFIVSGGSVLMFKRQSGTSTNLGGAFTYNSVTHLYFRIREQDNFVYFDTSADGSSWTNRRTIVNPISLNRIKPVFQVGNYATEASTTVVYFEDYNITAAGGAFFQTLNETVTYTDVFSKSAGRLLLETITHSDSIVRQVSRTISETITYTDTVIRQLARSLLETVTSSDTLTAVKTYLKTITDTVTHSDSLTKLTQTTRTETVTHTDTIIRQLSRTLVETVTHSDTLAIIRIFLKTLSETVTNSDSVQRQTARILAETATLTDALAKQATKVILNTITLTDALAAVKTYLKSLTETVTHTDTVQKQSTKPLTDTVTNSDTVQKSAGKPRNEAITLVDSLVRQLSRSFAETLTYADTLRRQVTKVIAETVTSSDTIRKVTLITKAEIATLSDSFQRQFNRLLGETLSFADTISRLIGKLITNTITIVDTLIAQKDSTALIDPYCQAFSFTSPMALPYAPITNMIIRGENPYTPRDQVTERPPKQC